MPHYTDSFSLLLNASLLARFAAPLCFNFLYVLRMQDTVRYSNLPIFKKVDSTNGYFMGRRDSKDRDSDTCKLHETHFMPHAFAHNVQSACARHNKPCEQSGCVNLHDLSSCCLKLQGWHVPTTHMVMRGDACPGSTMLRNM